ncbi:HlyD family secretion protein [Burkholderia cepacia]|uniref:HlyD family secretion protein n=1 Tax=Burkholderia cepacia TaxID=292 RepID=UPI00158B0571|nr:HlyD family efflux transporter periplasmic adaptor subunit [Burkholderia cepacia]MCA8054817.1 HlyD family efflux transporter periplasmic adaptor subunit [Burkholderia cepacia]MCA8132719.1 HlyD family efflux transporter periplasmic adaptor subunit [Burkholderia cepacia]MCA8160991.1 HlyD family efflux transporter periplasmic adaptor subunit [Burkholderia cepacia]MDN7616009.1 HlyD family efflux transporter periplasmic adaptor subunit [Burkholderia cepacia]HEM7894647.1 HlyD family efflux transp
MEFGLFRSEAAQARRMRVLGDIVLVHPLSMTLLTVVAMVMATCVVLFFAFGTYTRRTTVSGVVMPDAGLVKVYALQPGIVVERDVKEGQRVTRGQTLYTVSTDLQSAAQGATQAALIAQARQRKASLLAEMDKTRSLQQDERDTLRAKIGNLKGTLAQIDDQLAAQRLRTSIAADGATRYRGLLAQDYISKDQAQQREADLLDQQSKLNGLLRDRASTLQSITEASNELSGLGFKQQNQLAQIDRNVIDVDQNLIESEAKRRIVVTAPEAGIVTAAIADVGQSVDTSRPLASVVPGGARWQAHLFVPSTAIGFVRVGEPVLVRYQAFPYQKFGQYGATVVSIARTALSAAELANDGGPAATPGEGRDATFYRVIVALDAQHVTAYGAQQPLQAGMTLQADILQERRRLYEWVLEPLYSLTGKL